MNQAEFALQATIEPLLKEQGFRRRASGLTYSCRTNFGFHYLSITSFAMAQGGPYVFNAGLGVRHNRIDEVVNQLGHVWGETNRKNTTTVFRGLEFFPFDPKRDGRRVIAAEQIDAGIKTFASDLSAMLLTDGMQFFQSYSDVLNCSIGLNAPIDTRTHPLCNNFPLRAYYGVAAAALAQPKRVPLLLQSYAEFARDNGISDNRVYDVGKDLSGVDAIVFRLEFIADTTRASPQ